MKGFSCGKIHAAASCILLAAVLAKPAEGAIRLSWEYVYALADGKGYDLAVTPEGNLFIAGSVFQGWAGSSASKPFLICLSRYGVLYWTATFSGSGDDDPESAAKGIALHPSGDLVVAGQNWSAVGTGGDAWIARVTQLGELVWEKTIDGLEGGEDSFEAVAVNQTTGQIYAVGKEAACNPGIPNTRLWVVRMEADGSGECRYTHPGADIFCRGDSAKDVHVDQATGEVYVAGYVTSGTQGRDIWVGKFTGACSATPLWETTIDGDLSATDYASGIALDAAGDPIVVGQQTVQDRLQDIWAAKLDASTGTIIWSLTLDGGEGDNDSGFGCALDASGTIYLTGYADRRQEGAFEDIWLAGVTPAGTTMWEVTRDYLGEDTDIGRKVRVDNWGRICVVGQVVDGQMQTRIYLGMFEDYLLSSSGMAPEREVPYPAPNPVRDLKAGVTFRSLTSGAVIKIFTLAGTQIAEMADEDGDGIVTWAPVVNSSGVPLASGVYIYAVVPKSGSISRGKVVIIR